MKYITLHTPKMNRFIERRFSVTKEGALEMLLNAKLNKNDQKILWDQAVHTYERVINILANMGSTTSTLNIYMEKNPRPLVYYI